MPTLPAQLQRILFVLIKRIKADLEKELSEKRAGVTVLQYSVLHKVAREQQTLRQLATNMSMQPPSLMPSLDALERLKLLTRQPDSKDRRKIQLVITTKGKRLLTRIPLQDGSRDFNKALQKLGGKKVDQLYQLLQELADGMPTPKQK